jgi:alanine racemase
MNFTVVDVGEAGGVNEGDEVVLLGRQGGESIWADELAKWCQTIPYEILTSIRLHSGQARYICP